MRLAKRNWIQAAAVMVACQGLLACQPILAEEAGETAKQGPSESAGPLCNRAPSSEGCLAERTFLEARATFFNVHFPNSAPTECQALNFEQFAAWVSQTTSVSAALERWRQHPCSRHTRTTLMHHSESPAKPATTWDNPRAIMRIGPLALAILGHGTDPTTEAIAQTFEVLEFDPNNPSGGFGFHLLDFASGTPLPSRNVAACATCHGHGRSYSFPIWSPTAPDWPGVISHEARDASDGRTASDFFQQNAHPVYSKIPGDTRGDAFGLGVQLLEQTWAAASRLPEVQAAMRDPRRYALMAALLDCDNFESFPTQLFKGGLSLVERLARITRDVDKLSDTVTKTFRKVQGVNPRGPYFGGERSMTDNNILAKLEHLGLTPCDWSTAFDVPQGRGGSCVFQHGNGNYISSVATSIFHMLPEFFAAKPEDGSDLWRLYQTRKVKRFWSFDGDQSITPDSTGFYALDVKASVCQTLLRESSGNHQTPDGVRSAMALPAGVDP